MCLKHLWTDNTVVRQKVRSKIALARYVKLILFLYRQTNEKTSQMVHVEVDVVDYCYLIICYCLVLRNLQITGTSPKAWSISLYTTPVHKDAKGAVSLKQMNMIAILALSETLMLHTSPIQLGNVHVAAHWAPNLATIYKSLQASPLEQLVAVGSHNSSKLILRQRTLYTFSTAEGTFKGRFFDLRKSTASILWSV